MYCRFCGKAISKESRFCQHCGKELISASREIEEKKGVEPYLQEEKSSKPTFALLGSVIGLVVSILIAVNFFSGIIGGLWLVFSGGLFLVLYGIVLSIVMPWAYTVAFLPQMGLAALLVKPMEMGNKLLVLILGFLASSYGNLILAIWTVFVFENLVVQPRYSFIPLLLWGYSTMMAPLSYMASKEPPDSTGTSMGLLFAQLSFVLLTILFLVGSYSSTRNVALGILIVLFSCLTISTVVGSMRVQKPKNAL